MTDHHRTQLRVLAEMGISRPECAVFVALGYGCTLPPAELPRIAVAEYSFRDDVVTEDECRDAIAAGFAKGWLRIIDDAGLADIVTELRRSNIIGPIYGLPTVGGVDFTPAGADLWQRTYAQWQPADRHQHFAYTDVVRHQEARYFRTRAAAEAGIADAQGMSDVARVTGPTPTGPWRAQWWRRFPEGYRIDVESQSHWQGYCTGGHESCNLQRPPEKADPRRLRQILDRHNVTFAEWLLLAAVEDDGHCDYRPNLRRWWLTETAPREFGATVSEAEARVGRDACLRYGWLQVVDERAVAEIHALLRDDPTFLALPRTAENRSEFCYDLDPLRPGELGLKARPAAFRRGHTDFTPAGAALYRMISAEWLGPDWEDGLTVAKGYEWEEHLYCVSENGFERPLREHATRGEVIRARRLVPLGPWCVRWWSRCPAGFRLELELSDP